VKPQIIELSQNDDATNYRTIAKMMMPQITQINAQKQQKQSTKIGLVA
jgi:hypothetical protein